MKTFILFVTLCLTVVVTSSLDEKRDSDANTLIDDLTANSGAEEIDAPRKKRQFDMFSMFGGFGGRSRERWGGRHDGYNQGFGGGRYNQGFGGNGYNQGKKIISHC